MNAFSSPAAELGSPGAVTSPQRAEATINCRILPGHDPADVRASLIQSIGDTGVKISSAPPMEHALPSPLTPEIMGAIEKVTREVFGPGAPVIATITVPACDSKWLRAVGIPSYGVSGAFGDPNDNRAHGKDERVRIKSYYDSQNFLYRLVKELSTTPRSTAAAP